MTWPTAVLCSVIAVAFSAMIVGLGFAEVMAGCG